MRCRRPVVTSSSRTVLAVASIVLGLSPAAASARALGGEGIAPRAVHARTLADAASTGTRADRTVAPAALYAAIAAASRPIPSFSRQTGLACSACHYQFPQLTPFGRAFKLNGYTLKAIPVIGQPGDTTQHKSLELLTIPPLSAMVVASVTQTNKAQPGTQNGTAAFPDQLSVFLGGEITPNVGTFAQLTYSAADGALGVDNVDIRYANHRTVGDRQLLYGVTLHNNPTVQDVWNTVPAWGYPYMSSGSAPSPIASTLVDGGLGQQVVGLGAYTLFDGVVYAELTGYRSAQQGSAMPLDSTASLVVSGTIPYWRVALQHESKARSMMIGTYGLVARVYPGGVSGPTNHYSDVAVDAQLEQRNGPATWIGHASFIHERQQLDASVAAGNATSVRQTLSTARASIGYLPNLRSALTLAWFETSGTSDLALYPAAPVVGSTAGRPNTSGFVGEMNYNAWQNTRLGLQYAAYAKFNGASNAYDVPGGRRAADNNTLYAYVWLAF